MSREEQFATRMLADAPLMAILTGGVYQASLIGLEGIGRHSTPAAFDAAGWLRPCALVRQRGAVSTFAVQDFDAQIVSAAQTVEIWLYEDRGYTAIDAAIKRLKALLHGYLLEGTFEAEWTFTLDRKRDEGALAGSSLCRLDFTVNSIEYLGA